MPYQQKDASNICVNCSSNCAIGKCAIGNNSTQCLNCSSGLFMNGTAPNECINTTNCSVAYD